MSAKLTKLEQETLVNALDAWGECDGHNIDSRRVRTRTLNSLQAKGLIYSLGMDGRRPMTDAGFDAAKEARREANSRLFDAAPDMLAALEGVMDILGRAESNASGNPEWDYVGPRVAAARTAIAKALGRTPNEIGDEG